MKINLSDNVTMRAALSKVEEGEYFDALCLFARVDSYESILNQIGCLCELHDIGYAVDLYRKLLARFCFTHNCYTDVRSLGDATEIVMSYFGNVPKGEFFVSDERKYTANEQLLGFYPVELDDDFFDPEDIDYFAETLSDALNESHKSVFYDVKSPEYFLNVKRRMEKAYIEGNLAKGRALQREFMQLDTDDIATLEMQLFICLTQQRWEQGVKYALRIAKSPDATYRGMGAAAQILSRVEGYQEQLQHLLVRLTEYGEEISDFEMMDYLQISAAKLGYNELTLTLCNILYSHYKDAGCSALKLCARVYYNCNEFELAKDALLTLIRAVPWDSVAQTMLIYFNNGLMLPLDDPSGYNSLARHFDVPSQLSVVSQYKLLKILENNDYVLQKEDLVYVDCLLKVCGSYIVKGNAEKFMNETSVLSAIIDNFVADDPKTYFAFAKECLLNVLPEPNVNKNFLSKLIRLGYKGKLLISLNRGYYTLNLSHLTEEGQPFVEALSLAATLRKVDAKRLERSYLTLKQVFNTDFDCDAGIVRQIAYCLLAMSYKSFAKSTESSYFVEEDYLLYEMLVNLGK